ncbi:hypothetical protein DEO72_LG3g79 [Vigna unguiculata]|uniref:Uncharacterized protein n=1 Tax=Vigna unguiculata TaxID=3917 RepID=A0A4D6LAU9_VIGUN|nr:hypothetical protein DEO72_LG3g79 [Vigna unguiculata]
MCIRDRPKGGPVYISLSRHPSARVSFFVSNQFIPRARLAFSAPLSSAVFASFASPPFKLLCSKVPRRSSVGSFPECFACVVWPENMAVQRRTVARPVNLAQASLSRLGQMKRGARLSFVREKSPGRRAQFLSEQATRPSERDRA